MIRTAKKCTYCQKLHIDYKGDRCVNDNQLLKEVKVEVLHGTFWDQLLRKTTAIYKEVGGYSNVIDFRKK